MLEKAFLWLAPYPNLGSPTPYNYYCLQSGGNYNLNLHVLRKWTVAVPREI